MQRLPWFRLLIGFAVFGLIFSQIGLREATTVLSQSNLTLIIIVVLLNLPILVLVTLRSAVLLRRFGQNPPLRVLSLTSTVGYVVGALTPAAAGEVLRVQTLSSRGGVPVRVSVMLVAVERLLSFYLLCLCAAMAAAWAMLSWQLALPLIGLLVPMAALPVFADRLLRLIPDAAPEASGLRAKAFRVLRGVGTDVFRVLADRVSFAAVTMFSVAIFALVAAQFWLLAGAVKAGISFDEAWMAFGVSQVAGIASMLPFGIGISDGSLTAILGVFQVNAKAALAVALLVRLAISLPLTLVAAAAYGYLVMPGRPAASLPQLSIEKS